MKHLVVIIVFLAALCQNVPARENHPVGEWTTDKMDLPCFHYTGAIPFKARMANGKEAKMPDDPWFLLGNYQLTLFTHVSGQYELITGQRAWGRMNQGDTPDSGDNEAWLEQTDGDGNVTEVWRLTGIKNSLAANPSQCQRKFGCGYADYSYKIGKLEIVRTLTVAPSETIDGGASAFRLTVTVRNRSREVQCLRYHEDIRANYEFTRQQYWPKEHRPITYPCCTEAKGRLATARFTATTGDPMLFRSPEAQSRYEGFPPALFMYGLTDGLEASASSQRLSPSQPLTLKPGEEREIEMIIGFSHDSSQEGLSQLIEAVPTAGEAMKAWKRILPDYKDEADLELRRELTWHAYVLEAMATYSTYYHETKIPQGTCYDYSQGQHASARDNMQHGLATIYYHPELARSIIRYMLKRTRDNGEVVLIEYGNGYAEQSIYITSDQQLWLFLLISEYLRVTHDYAFLNEKVACFPVKGMPEYTVQEFITRCFTFLRHQIGTGSHGLVNLWNADWNDAVYYCLEAPYNLIVYGGESLMNTAMACSILEVLTAELQRAESVSNDKEGLRLTVESMTQWRGWLVDNFMRDWGDRAFPRRIYCNGKSYGEENMYVESQGFTLMMKDVPVERKQRLYAEMQRRLYAGEKLGAREQQAPETPGLDWETGSRENGGFWYSMNGPIIAGVATFDTTEAMRLLRQMSFANYARQFPDYWTSYWSAADTVESSLIESEGLPDQTSNYPNMPVFCAHPHAWMLYCYNRIREYKNN